MKQSLAILTTCLIAVAPILECPADGADSSVMCPDIPQHRQVLEEGKNYYLHVPGGHASIGNQGLWMNAPWHPDRTDKLPVEQQYVIQRGSYSHSFELLEKTAASLDPSPGQEAETWESCAILHASEGARKYLTDDFDVLIIDPQHLRSVLKTVSAKIAAEDLLTRQKDEHEFAKHCSLAEDSFKKAIAARERSSAQQIDDLAGYDMISIATLEEVQGRTVSALQWYQKGLHCVSSKRCKGPLDLLSPSSFVAFCIENANYDELSNAQPELLKWVRLYDDAEPINLVIADLVRRHEKNRAKLVLRAVMVADPNVKGLDCDSVAEVVSEMTSTDVGWLVRRFEMELAGDIIGPDAFGVKKGLRKYYRFGENSGRPTKRPVWMMPRVVFWLGTADEKECAFQPVLTGFEEYGWLNQAESIYKLVAENGQIYSRIQLLKFYQRHGRVADADAQSKLVVDEVRRLPDVKTADLQKAVGYLAEALKGAKRETAGYKLLSACNDRLNEQLMHRQCLDVSAQLDTTGGDLESADAYEMAEKMYKEALAIKEKNLVADDPFVADELCNIGRVLGDQQKIEEAARYFERALAIYRKNGVGADRELSNALAQYGEALEKCGKKELSEQIYDQAREVMKRSDAREARPEPKKI